MVHDRGGGESALATFVKVARPDIIIGNACSVSSLSVGHNPCCEPRCNRHNCLVGNHILSNAMVHDRGGGRKLKICWLHLESRRQISRIHVLKDA